MMKLITVILVVLYFTQEVEAIASAMSHHNENKKLVCFFTNFITQCVSAFFDYEQCFSEQQATMPEYEHSLAATARKTYSFTQHGTKNEVFH